MELALPIQKIVGQTRVVLWDDTKPDGAPLKLMDISKMYAIGWNHQFNLED
ncbi:hypothetical protein QO200_08110 [Flavobacterium sp. Arc3]|jgi:GDP-L-fucose synthase|uniref:hypothetical protein n=1 Tax=unclassified Flavobacterium TaxID=196869 RepID=UPI00352E45AC